MHSDMTTQKKRSREPYFLAIAAVSVDGFLSDDPTKTPNWTSKEDWGFLQKTLETCDAILVGRKTFEAARERLLQRNTFVITSQDHIPGVTTLPAHPKTIRDTLRQFSKVAILGGTGVYGLCIDAGLIDELLLTVEPIFLGRGNTLTRLTKRHHCRLVRIEQLNKKGTVLLTYTFS